MINGIQEKHTKKPFTRTQLEHIIKYSDRGREVRLARQLLELMIHVELTGERRRHGD